MPKTIMVEVSRDHRHPLYEKVLRSSKKYLVHDEIGCRPGDEVVIVESQPISKRKRFVVQEIIAKVTDAEVKAEREEIVEEAADVIAPVREAPSQAELEAEAEGEVEEEAAAEAEAEAEE
jgi:small subunit ribosomal protein S17